MGPKDPIDQLIYEIISDTGPDIAELSDDYYSPMPLWDEADDEDKEDEEEEEDLD